LSENQLVKATIQGAPPAHEKQVPRHK